MVCFLIMIQISNTLADFKNTTYPTVFFLGWTVNKKKNLSFQILNSKKKQFIRTKKNQKMSRLLIFLNTIIKPS